MPIRDWTRVHARIFHRFHERWVGAITDALNQRLLPPDYYALAEQQGAGFDPDVLTFPARWRAVRAGGRCLRRAEPVLGTASGTAAMNETERIDAWISDLGTGLFDPRVPTAAIIESMLHTAGSAAVRRLSRYFAAGPPNRFGWHPEDLKAALARLIEAEPDAFLDSFPDSVMG